MMYTHEKQNTLSHTSGFSLVEMLVYISVLVIVSSAAVAMIFTLDDMFVRNKLEQTISNSAEVALETFTRDIRDGFTIHTINSTLDSSPGQLQVESSGTTTLFSVVDGQIHANRNGESPGPITSKDVVVEKLLFLHLVSTETEAVRTKLVLSAHAHGETVTRTYYTTTVLRGSYD